MITDYNKERLQSIALQEIDKMRNTIYDVNTECGFTIIVGIDKYLINFKIERVLKKKE